MKTIKENVIEKVEDTLDKYFPKGDKRRGEVLLLIALSYTETLAEVEKVIEEFDWFSNVDGEWEDTLKELKERLRGK